MLNCLKRPKAEPFPFQDHLNRYLEYLLQDQGLSENTIYSLFFQLKDFFSSIREECQGLSMLTPLMIDGILIKKHEQGGYARVSVQEYASVIRSFLRYAETQQWCSEGLANTVKAPRVYRQESLPSSPSWEDIKKVVKGSYTDHPTDIRDHAILQILVVYGLRCSEIAGLRLQDLDWKRERFYLRRAKSLNSQVFPLSSSVGNALIRYLQEVRPSDCRLQEVFVCRRAPYRPLSTSAVYQIVNRRLKPLNLNIKHQGPHCLRHACATRLINKGFSLKEISDHLGHQNLDTTRIYAKVDLSNLRKVAEMNWEGLL
jgi:site-specific recombinase XerD